MIERKINTDGIAMFHEGNFWIHQGAGGNVTVMYHNCNGGSDRDILLEEEMLERECTYCGPISIPDDLWTLYVLLDGRGIHA